MFEDDKIYAFGYEQEARRADPTPAVPAAGAPFYTQYANASQIPANCNGTFGDKMPNECCTATYGAQTNVFAGDFSTTTCSPVGVANAPSLNVRNFYGCENGVATMGEACVPTGLVLGQTYPFPAANASQYAVNGNVSTCACGAGGAYPAAIYRQGPGCYIAFPTTVPAG